MRLRLFGTAALLHAAGEEPLLPERLTQLAVVLAARADWMTREQLIPLLWPELDGESARRNLRKLLFRARRQPWLDGLEARPDALRWRVESDLREFEAACTAQDWSHAVAAYGGVYCDGFEHKAAEPFVEWLRFERNRLAGLFRTAVASHASQLAADPRAREALARRWLTLEPLDEDALVVLAEAVQAQGRGAEAQRVVAEFTERLARDVGVAPSARVRAFAGTPSAPTSTVTTIRADADFVGRRVELREVLTLLARDECRVLTITGPGGIGKSRLARAVMAAAATPFDTMHWIALGDLTDVAHVAARIAATVGATLSGATEPLAQVSAALRDRRALLVFDNSEHLAGIPALVAQLAAACPQSKLLLTSRARLAVAGEWLLPLSGLPVPEADETETEVLRAFDAVKLFELRARAAAPSFDAARSARQVAAVVRLLEGAPLAIELAAAWTRMLPTEEIRHEIERSLDVLEDAAHAPDRHRSVRASFEHSWRLLTPVEQDVLTRLAVFAGPFTREAAAHVADAGLPVLAALVDKSLLRAHGDGRFSFHALMRECARERLADIEASEARHADYFVRTLAHFPPSSSVHDARLQLIEPQLEDYRLAWRRAVRTGDAAALQAMALPLMRFFLVKGRFAEGMAVIGEGLDSLPAASSMTHAMLHHALGTLQYRRGDLGAAAHSMQRAIDLYRALRAPTSLVRPCIVILSMIAWTRGDPRTARRHFEEVLPLARADGDTSGSAQALNGLALCARALGEFERALALHEEALRLLQHAENAQLEASVLHDLGSLQFTLRHFTDSRRTLQRGLAVCEANALTGVRLFCLLSLAFAEIELQELESAQGHLEQALHDDQAAGQSLISAMLHLAHARINTRRGDLAGAASWLKQGLERARALASAPTGATALNCAAEWLVARGERGRAAAVSMFVATHPQAEEGEREDARDALDRLRLGVAETEAARREAQAFAPDSLIDTLIAELAGA